MYRFLRKRVKDQFDWIKDIMLIEMGCVIELKCHQKNLTLKNNKGSLKSEPRYKMVPAHGFELWTY